jgi:hypothetical protein
MSVTPATSPALRLHNSRVSTTYHLISIPPNDEHIRYARKSYSFIITTNVRTRQGGVLPAFSPFCTQYPPPLISSDGRCVPLTTLTASLKTSKRVTEDERIRYACRFYHFFLSTNLNNIPQTSDGGRAYKVRLSIVLFVFSDVYGWCTPSSTTTPLLSVSFFH